MARDKWPPPACEVPVSGAAAEAVRSGALPGTVYRDGECWAERAALRAWALQAAGEEDRGQPCGEEFIHRGSPP
jgi:hypothetical protein